MKSGIKNYILKNGLQGASGATWILGGILLLAIVLRVCPLEDLTRGGIENGEGYTMAHAALPLSQIIANIPYDQAPMKYYLLHALLYFGRSEFLIRVPAIFFDLASILMLFCLGRLLFGKKAALLASFFMAISTWHIYHATMARNYPLYAFSALTSTFFLYRATQGARVRDWLFFGVAAALGLYSFSPSIFILAAQLLWFFICYSRRSDLIKRLLLSLGLFFVLSAPLMARLPQAFQFKVHWGIGHWGLEGCQIWEALRDHFGGVAGSYPWGIFVFITSFVWLFYFQKKRRQALFLSILVLVPICLYVFCIYVFQINVLPRHFLHVYPFFLLMAAAGIVSWPHRAWKLAGIFVFMLPLCLYGFYQMGLIKRSHIPYDYLRQGDDFAALAAFIEKNYDSLDFVVLEEAPTIFSVQYYLDRANKFPVVAFRKNFDQDLYAMYTDSKITLYGFFKGGLPELKRLAASGRLLVVDSPNKIVSFENGPATITWLKTNAYRIEHGNDMDFYFISPPANVFTNLEDSVRAERQKLLSESRVLKRLIYPFNHKEWAQKEWDLHEN